MLQLMDTYSGGWNVLLISLCECMSLAWVYGFLRFRKDIGVMLGDQWCGCIPWLPVSWWWGLCWCFLTPLGKYNWIEVVCVVSVLLQPRSLRHYVAGFLLVLPHSTWY